MVWYAVRTSVPPIRSSAWALLCSSFTSHSLVCFASLPSVRFRLFSGSIQVWFVCAGFECFTHRHYIRSDPVYGNSLVELRVFIIGCSASVHVIPVRWGFPLCEGGFVREDITRWVYGVDNVGIVIWVSRSDT